MTQKNAYFENQLLDKFITYLKIEKGLAANTIMAYSHDLANFIDFLEQNGISILNVRQDDLSKFMYKMNSRLSPRSLARTLVSIRMLYRFLIIEGIIEHNPTRLMSIPKLRQHLPNILNKNEVETLLSQPSAKTILGKRDRAILELLYATGLRVSELTSLEIKNINLLAGYIRTLGKGSKERIIPVGSKAIDALKVYLEQARPSLLKNETFSNIFLNSRGKPLSRQGLWKIIKNLSIKAGIIKKVTPHMLRHSFATHLIEDGVHITVVQKLLGHSSTETTMVYVHTAKVDMIDVRSPLDTK